MAYRGIDVPYHQQEQGDNCGVAVAQMVLAALGSFVPRQGDLGSGLMRSSDVARLLNCKRPFGFPARFRPVPASTFESGCRQIALALISSGVPVPVCVFEPAHWVLVTGVVLDREPAPDVEARIQGFFISDPMPDIADIVPKPGLPPPHGVGDGCGSGDDRGSRYIYVTIAGWAKDYWTSDGGATESPFSVVVTTMPQSRRIRLGVAATSVCGPPPQSDADIARVVSQGIRDHQLDLAGPLQALLGLHDQLPVTFRTDDAVAFDAESWCGQPRGRRRIVSLTLCERLFGTALVDEDGSFHALQVPTSENELALIAYGVDELDAVRAFIADRPGADVVIESRRLVWRLSAQSSSPFRPLVELRTNRGTLYRSVNGRVTDQLDPLPCTT